MHNKTKTNTEPHNQWEARQTTEQQQQNHRLRTDSSISHRGLKCILLVPTLRPIDSVVVKKHIACMLLN